MALRTIYYDTETTGLRADKDRIIEIAAYDPVSELSFVRLINPGMPIPREASAVHKITDEMVANSPGFSEIGAEFVEFCKGDVVLIAHNNDAFDLQFLKQEFGRNQMTLPDWKFLDTLKWARRYRPDLPRHTLQFLREIYGIAANNAHRALDDVIVLHRVFSSMTDDLPIEKLYEIMNRPQTTQEISRMPFGKFQGKSLDQVPRDYVTWLAGSGAFEKSENQQLKAAFEKLGVLI